MFNNKPAGILSIILASIMWAIEPILTKLSFKTTDFFNTFFTRVLFSLVVITIYILFTNPRQLILGRRQLGWLVFLSLAATLFADFIYTYTLTKVMVINAVLIGHMQPIFIVMLGFFLLKSDRLTKFDYLGIIFMLCAGLFVTTRTLDNIKILKFGTPGDLYVLLATIAWATTAIATRKHLKEIPASVIAFYRFLFAGIIFFVYMLLFRTIKINNIYQILLGFIIGTGTILYYEGLRRIKAAQVAALELSTPFFASFLGYVVLKESLTPWQGMGLIFLVFGIYLLSKKEKL